MWTISAASSMTISDAVNTGGGDVNWDVTDDIHINAAVTTGGGTVTAKADNDLTFGVAGSLTTSGGNVALRADDDGDGDGSGGALTMADGASVHSDSGTITLSADEAVTIARLISTNNTSAAVTITSTSGSLLDAGDGGGADIVATGDNAVVTISTATGIGATDNALETNVTTLAGSVRGTGDITITETDAIALSPIETADGAIDVTAGGTITAASVNTSATDDGTNDITLTTTAGDIATETVSAGYSNDATINAAGSITEDGVLSTGITANVLDLSAGGSITVDTTAISLTATTSAAGGIDIDQTGAITLTSVITHNGSITVDAGGDLIAISLSTANTDSDANDIALATSVGGIQVGSLDAGTLGDVQLNSAVAVIDDGNQATMVTAGELQITAQGAVSVDTAVDSLTVTTSLAGDVDIDEANAITLTSIESHDGSITVDAGDAITVTSLDSATTDDGSNNIQITTRSGAIGVTTIRAGGQNDVTLTAAGAITDDGDGDTTITADVLTAEAGGSITLDTKVASATITTTAGGAVDIDEIDSITLAGVTTHDGGITVDAAGQIIATSVNASGTDNGNNSITLTTTVGDLSVVSVNAGSLNDVTLTAEAGFITEDGTLSIEVTANELTATAAGPITLDTQVDSAVITTTETGAVDLHDTDSITLTNIVTQDGDISVQAGDGISVITVTAGTAGNVNLTAAGAITEDDDTTTDITGDDISLTAGTTIGAAGSVISLAAATLTTASTSGQHLSETDSISITAIDAASSSLSVYGGTWYLGPGDRVASGSTLDIQTGATVDVNGADGDNFTAITVSGGTLVGEGTVDADLSMNAGLTTPGYSPGVINTNNLAFSGGVYRVELDGTTAGSGAGHHDQLNVSGSVDLGSGTTLEVTVGYLPDLNDRFVIINNDGTGDLVTGTFAGLAEGADFIASGIALSISYVGGDGNDVELTAGDQNTVYVDDAWLGTDRVEIARGTDPDGTGPARSFGFDSFATIQAGIDAVADDGEVVIYDHAGDGYSEALVIDESTWSAKSPRSHRPLTKSMRLTAADGHQPVINGNGLWGVSLEIDGADSDVTVTGTGNCQFVWSGHHQRRPPDG